MANTDFEKHFLYFRAAWTIQIWRNSGVLNDTRTNIRTNILHTEWDIHSAPLGTRNIWKLHGAVNLPQDTAKNSLEALEKPFQLSHYLPARNPPLQQRNMHHTLSLPAILAPIPILECAFPKIFFFNSYISLKFPFRIMSIALESELDFSRFGSLYKI